LAVIFSIALFSLLLTLGKDVLSDLFVESTNLVAVDGQIDTLTSAASPRLQAWPLG